MPSISSEPIRRILIVRLAMIGDAVLTTPVMRSLRRTFPGSHLTFLTSMPAARDLLLHHPDLDEVIVSDKNVLQSLARMEPYDLVLDLFGSRASQSICLVSGARFRVGLGNHTLLEVGDIEVYNVRRRAPIPGTNVLDEFLGSLRALGITDRARTTRLFLTNSEKQEAAMFLRGHRIPERRNIVALQPGGDSSEKLWEEVKFAEVVRRLSAMKKGPVLLFQAQGDCEPVASRIHERLQEETILVPCLPIRSYAAILGSCRCLLSIDGGAVHIAIALGVRTVAIFRNPRSKFWFPYDEHTGRFLSHGDDSPVSVDDVLTSLKAFL